MEFLGQNNNMEVDTGYMTPPICEEFSDSSPRELEMELDLEVDPISTGWEGVYHEKFPQEWATFQLEGTGPHECNNCADYGCVGDTFIGYCVNCAIYAYENTRGRGFINKGVEFLDEETIDVPGAFDTYLSGLIFDGVDALVDEPLV